MIGAIGGLAAAYGMADNIFGWSRKREAEQSFSNWKKQFDYESAYNTPSAQRQRLVDANLSPSLMYGGGLTNTTTANPSFSSADASPSKAVDNVISSLQQHQNVKLMNEQIENMRADRALKEQQLDFNESNNPTVLDTGKSRLESQNIRNRIDKLTADNQLTRQILDNTGIDLRNRQQQKFIEQMDEKHRNSMREILTRIRNMNSSTDLNRASIEATKVRQELDELEVEMRKSGTSFNDELWQRKAVQGMKNLLERASDAQGSDKKGLWKGILDGLLQLF